jgi:sugar lactone lactonase YvrE
MAFDEVSNTLYVADNKNHAVRAIDLGSGAVRTLAGNGQQGRDYRGGKSGRDQPLNSPWDLALSPDRKVLYIAMAGPHQLWQLDLATNIAKVLAGSGQEDIIDGSADSAALAQPSGLSLSTDAKTLYFADSETSSIRRLDFKSGQVSTIIGSGLFEFGDIDGAYPAARLQHPLGVAVLPTPEGDRLLVADTYNHKLRLMDPKARTVTGWLGTGRKAGAPDDLRLDEPGGLFLSQAPGQPSRLFVADTNNHRVVMVDPATKRWREVVISGLESGDRPSKIPASAAAATVQAAEGKTLTLSLAGALPPGAHPNSEAPVTIQVSRIDGNSPTAVVAQRTLRTDRFPVTIEVPGAAIKPGAALLVELSFAYCTEGDAAMCAPGEAAWRLTIENGSAVSASLAAKPD